MKTTKSQFNVDKRVLSIGSLFDEPDEKEYWLSRTPYERLLAVELMRQVIYGYKPTAARLQRFFEVAEFKTS